MSDSPVPNLPATDAPAQPAVAPAAPPVNVAPPNAFVDGEPPAGGPAEATPPRTPVSDVTDGSSNTLAFEEQILKGGVPAGTPAGDEPPNGGEAPSNGGGAPDAGGPAEATPPEQLLKNGVPVGTPGGDEPPNGASDAADAAAPGSAGNGGEAPGNGGRAPGLPATPEAPTAGAGTGSGNRVDGGDEDAPRLQDFGSGAEVDDGALSDLTPGFGDLDAAIAAAQAAGSVEAHPVEALPDDGAPPVEAPPVDALAVEALPDHGALPDEAFGSGAATPEHEAGVPVEQVGGAHPADPAYEQQAYEANQPYDPAYEQPSYPDEQPAALDFSGIDLPDVEIDEPVVDVDTPDIDLPPDPPPLPV
ncbi:MAG: hypothetical protein IPM45_09745 [Acidimicrobiales bacterium]|nr:hypothetical protein [Acidimicrobiales bacterium]